MSATDQALAAKRKGDEAFVKSEYETAIGHYTDALDLCRDIKNFEKKIRARIFSSRAECYIRLKNFKSAISDCDAAFKNDASNLKCKFRRAKANEALSHYKDALIDLQFVIKRDPKHTQAIDLMRTVQRKLGMGTGGKKDQKLDYDPETDVSYSDQLDICNYNIINHQKIELEDEIALLAKEVRGLEDASESIEMVLDDDACRLMVGQCFFPVSNEDSEEYCKNEGKVIKLQIKEKQTRLHEMVNKLTQLRAKLKAKFGDHIGLPEIKPSQYAGK